MTRAPASGESSGAAASAASTGSAPRDGALRAIDPCTLLGPAQLKPFLANTSTRSSRVDEAGKNICAWGDGEFRSVRLSVWQPASAAELTDGAVRQVRVDGREVQVITDSEFTCQLRAGDPSGAVELLTVTTDKAKLCGDTTTALRAVLAKLGR